MSLVLLKEIVKFGNPSDTTDRTINPDEVVSIKETVPGNTWSVLKLTDGTEINVKGNVKEITIRLNGSKSILKG